MSKLVFTQALTLFCLVATLNGAYSQESAGEAGPEPYSYSYETEGSSASEQKDQNGNVVGFYTVSGPDGRSRRVEYTADASGFHAKVVSNEVGMKSSSPANVEVVAEQPSAEQMRQSASYSEYQSGVAQQAAAAGVQVAGGPVVQQQKWFGSYPDKYPFSAAGAGQSYGQQQSAGAHQYSYGQQSSSGQQVYKQQAAGVAGSGQQQQQHAAAGYGGQYASGQYVSGPSSSSSYYKSQYSSSVQPATASYGQGVRYQMVAVPYQTVAYQGVPYQSTGVSYQSASVPYQSTGVSYQSASVPYQATGVSYHAASVPYQSAGVAPAAAGTVSSYQSSSVTKSSVPYQASSVQAAAPESYQAVGGQKSASSYSGSSNYIVLKS